MDFLNQHYRILRIKIENILKELENNPESDFEKINEGMRNYFLKNADLKNIPIVSNKNETK